MAEFVQFRSEQTISELEQMQRIELFSKEEVRLIAAKRKRYEYKMERLGKSKDTYLRYIQYELDLIRLIKLRREKTKILYKESEIEHVIKNRINSLFFQALAKFKPDIKMWVTHIKFCMQWKMMSTISGILTRMVAVHGAKPKVWKFAANWEFEHNQSVETGRKLMLRGLRFHEKSKLLFKAYLAMELKYAQNKMEVLIENDNLETDLILAEIEIMSKKLKQKDEKSQHRLKMQIEEKQALVAKRSEAHQLNTELAEIILDSALMRFRDPRTFVELFGVITPVKRSTPLQLTFLRKLHEKFPCNALFHDLEAKMSLQPNYYAKTCKAAYATALKDLPTEPMWSLYLESMFLAIDSPTKNELLKKEMKACHDLVLLNERFYPKMMMLFDVQNQETLPVLLEGLQRCPKSGQLHQLHVAVHLSNGDEDAALSAFERAERNLGKDNLEMLVLYKTIVQHYEVANFALADKLFKRCLFAGPNVGAELKPRYLQWVSDKKGIEAACAEYHTMKLTPPLTLALHFKMIDLEMSQPEVDTHNVRLCFELASHQFGEKDIGVWMRFIAFETAKGDPKHVPLVYGRAKAQLSADLLEEFVAQYTVNRSNGEV